MDVSRGQRIALMAINKQNESLPESNKIDNILVLQTVSNSVNCSEILTNTQDEYSFQNTSTISKTEKQCGVPQSSLDASLFDINNIPVIIVEENKEHDLGAVILTETLDQSYLDNSDIREVTSEENLNATKSTIVENDIIHNKLVNYSSSSESENHNDRENSLLKKKKLKRFDSDYSFYEEKDSDFFYSSSDSEQMIENSTNTVGESGLKKTKKVSMKKIKKSEKTLGILKTVQENPCKNKRCQNACAKKFTEQERHDIFDYYWGLGTHQRQRDWLLSCIKEIDVKRRRINTENSRRNRTFKYFITWNGKENEVCQQFILKTLCISQMTLRYTKNNAGDNIFAKLDQRGKHDPPHKTSIEDKNRVHQFIKKLPAVPSHYCRASTTKKYLPSELRNVSFLYRIFVRDQLEFHKIKTKVSLKVFRHIFNNDFNIGFHLPKKDKCTICESRKDEEIKFTQIEEITYQNHMRDKEECKQLFLSDQNIAKEDNSFVCASFDLQKVLNTPHGDNMLLYYSRKYAFYNETVYESGTRNVYCYLWGETDGNRGTNEISTIIYKYLEEVDDRVNVKTVSLYCDSCAGQNKNRAMLAMLHTFLKKSKNIHNIKITFLLSGHTYMPVDAVHATIERFIRKRVVWAPSEWSTIIRNARINPKPFHVVNMKYSDFLSWKTMTQSVLPSTVNKTKEGRTFQISKLRTAFLKKGEDMIKIRYSYSNSAEELMLPVFCGLAKGRRSKTVVTREPEILYPSPLEISSLKFADLMELCNKHVIPQQFVNEYRKFEGNSNVQDTLAETDAEDQQSDRELS